jgi:hypothetical protein
MGTIENLNNVITDKIRGLRKAIAILEHDKVEVSDVVKKQVEDIFSSYLLASVGLLNRYFLFARGDKKENTKFYRQKDIYLLSFQRLVNRENYLSDLELLRETVCSMAKTNRMRRRVCESLNFISISTGNSRGAKAFRCGVCKVKMEVSPNMSILMCVKCGAKENLRGMIFEDDQFFQQEGQRTKHGAYEPTKHCKLWVDRIQARETKEIPPKLIRTLTKNAKQDKVQIRRLTCENIRLYLQKTRNSRYNEHIPLIRKIMTGISPPQLTELERRKIHIYFDQIISIYSDIKPMNKTNTNYHPYYILKILEQIIKDRIRRKNMIVCIHLQSRETLIEHDRLWKKVCARIPDFKYRPTDRHEYEQEW